MTQKLQKIRRGFTIVETVIAVVIMLIVMLGVASVMADGIRGWNIAYDRANGDLASQSLGARRAFEKVLRTCTYKMPPVTDTGGTYLDLYYFSTAGYTKIDRRVRFFVASNQLKCTHYSYPEATALGTQVLASNVSACAFKVNGQSVQMILTMTQNSRTVTTVGSAFIHN